MYLTAQEAAATLGVSVRTLYSYVSRKSIRTRSEEGSRQKLYWSEDIARLSGDSPAQQKDHLLDRTAVTVITAAGPHYRGHSAVELSQWASLEDAAAILWNADSPFSDDLPRQPPHFAAIRASLGGLSTAEKAISLFPMIEHANPKALDLSPEGYVRSSVDVVRLYAALLAGLDWPPETPIHEAIGRGLGASPQLTDLIRRSLVLSADHELDPTTYSVRSAAATGVTPYYAAIVGLSTFRGRRLHQGRSGAVGRFIEELTAAADPTQPVLTRLRDGEQVPGFGSRVYPQGDPRAQALFSAMEDAIGDDRDFMKLQAAIKVAEDLTGQLADFILAASFLRHKVGLPSSEGAMVGPARIVGWCAHAMEQYDSQDLVRHRASYVGPLPGSSRLEHDRRADSAAQGTYS
jgi:citrate synthase